jgi:thioredoxin 1
LSYIFQQKKENLMRKFLYSLCALGLMAIPSYPDAGMSVHSVTGAEFNREVLHGTMPVLVDFWADWCGPCLMVAPILEDLSMKYAGKMKFCKLNVDEHQGIARKYGITRIPCIKIFRGGRVIDELWGFYPRDEMESFITRNLRQGAGR